MGEDNRQRSNTIEISSEIQAIIRKECTGELRVDPVTRLLFSTDASLYQIEPLGVFFPRSEEDICAVMEVCSKYNLPVLPRGSGSSLAGQAIGRALIIDCSKFLRQKISIDSERSSVIADPGVHLNQVNRAAAAYGLMIGPDPASADRATVGGSVANNATGAHSILFGMLGDHVLEVKTVLADGHAVSFRPQSIAVAEYLSQRSDHSIETNLYRAALQVREHQADVIKQHWPSVWRRASGYGVHYLLPWSPSVPPQWRGAWNTNHLDYPPSSFTEINLAQLFAGSEGTLGILTEITLRLVPKPKESVLAVMEFDSIHLACDAAATILGSNPSAIELIPGSMVRLARSVPAYAHQLGFVDGTPAALLAVEYSGEKLQPLLEKGRSLNGKVRLAIKTEDQNSVWNVRNMGLGILNSLPGDDKPISFIEDIAVPVERLGEFTRQIERIMADHGTTGEFYAHASAGCLHIRPILNLKKSTDVVKMRQIAAETVELTIQLGGAVSGEHGDGLARSEWMERLFGQEILAIFRQIKTAADPMSLLNPGKILDAPPMDENLRYDGYQVNAWSPKLDFSNQQDFPGAIEMCNGAGVCRKESGLMCPSYQVTHEEEHSTRGRANLLRGLISGKFSDEQVGEDAVMHALDLCLACKGCRSECPSLVDLAKLKYEFLHHYYKEHPRSIRDRLIANIGTLAKWGAPVGRLINLLGEQKSIRTVAERFVGISSKRHLPHYVSHSHYPEANIGRFTPQTQEDVFFLEDAFSHYFHPQVEAAGLELLKRSGVRARKIPVMGAGRTFISKGYLDEAKRHLRKLMEWVDREDPESTVPIVGVEPSEIYTLRDELLELFPQDPRAMRIAERAWMLDEFLLRPGVEAIPRFKCWIRENEKLSIGRSNILFHAHCYQKARPPADDGLPVGTAATVSLLNLAGHNLKLIEAGCCGMAGGFGYEAEHYKISMAVGELVLFPTIRLHGEDWIVAATGTSCRSQIEDGTGRKAIHPLEILMADL